eukprot:10582868-Alexandrium_andersonii.AAC.1
MLTPTSHVGTYADSHIPRGQASRNLRKATSTWQGRRQLLCDRSPCAIVCGNDRNARIGKSNKQATLPT